MMIAKKLFQNKSCSNKEIRLLLIYHMNKHDNNNIKPFILSNKMIKLNFIYYLINID